MFLHMCTQLVITMGRMWRVGRCANTSQLQHCTRFSTSWWLKGVELCWSKMKPCSSSSGCLGWRVGLTSTCQSVQLYWPLTIVPIGMGWLRTSPFHLKDMMCTTVWAPWLCHAIYFLDDVWSHQSAFCHFSWGSNECIHDSSSVKMWSRNALSSFLQYCR